MRKTMENSELFKVLLGANRLSITSAQFFNSMASNKKPIAKSKLRGTSCKENIMRDQYAGDISDFFKFAFLRAVASDAEINLGVGWFYVDANDGRPDGKHTEYLEQTHLRDLDPVLFDQLSNLPERSVKALQALPIWNDTTVFHTDPIPSENNPVTRQAWSWKMAQELSGCNVVFIDPDNSVTWNGSITSRHARLDEVKVLASNNRPLIFIKFPSRDKKHPQQIADLHQGISKNTHSTH